MKANKEEDGEEEEEGKKELFVRNLAFTVDEDGINSHFEKYGEITNIKLLRS